MNNLYALDETPAEANKVRNFCSMGEGSILLPNKSGITKLKRKGDGIGGEAGGRFELVVGSG